MARLLDVTAPGPGLASLQVLGAHVKLDKEEAADAVLGPPRAVLAVDLRGAPMVEEAPARPPLRLVLIIDVSYSMAPALSDVRDACMEIFHELKEEDEICLVSFSSFAKLILPLRKKRDVEDYARLCELKPEAATNIQAGLEMGLEQLQREAGAAPPQRGFLDWLRGAAPQDEAADVEQASSMAILLSDGQPNGGISDKQGLLSLASRLCPSEVTMHAFGFTQSHDIDLMSALPSKSSGKPGSYYYLGSAQDIGAAVGDALGAVSWQPCRNLQLRVEGPTGGGWYGPPDANAEEDAPLLGLQESRSLVALGAKERQILLYAMPENTSLPPAVTLRLTWSTEQEGEQSYEAQLLLEKLDTSASSALSALAVRAHVLRFQVAHALTALAVSPAAHERFAHVHQAVLDGLISLQALEDQEEDQEAIFLEGMLQALERDLGEALASQDRSSERKGVLLSFAAEHFGMHSASSLTRLRTTYASQQQIQTRLRFLQSTKPGAVDAKAACVLDETLEPALTEAEKKGREDMEEQVCYAMLSNWRDCVLGVGLHVHPRTARERRAQIPPEVDLVLDYVSAEAYNLGVRSTVQLGALPREADEDEDGLPGNVDPAAAPVLTSTVKRRINAWLPLYINPSNWAVSRTFAPSAFSLIATQLNTAFKPSDALQVCARLMCCAVVGFVRSADVWQRAEASQRSVQMYCHIHRLLLQMAEEYPEIKELAEQKVTGFINDTQKRTRKGTSDLGLLIVYLSLCDTDWPSLRDVFVPEMLRRAFARMTEAFCPEYCESEQELLDRFDKLEPEHGRVIAFFLVFNDLVVHRLANLGPGEAGRVSKLKEQYDRCWGQISSETCIQVMEGIKRIRSTSSVEEMIRELLPQVQRREDVVELLLWASKHGHNPKAIQDWPKFPLSAWPCTKAWQKHLHVRRHLRQETLAELQRATPLAALQRLLQVSLEDAPLDPPLDHTKTDSEMAKAEEHASRPDSSMHQAKRQKKAEATVSATAVQLKVHLSEKFGWEKSDYDVLLDEHLTVADLKTLIAEETGLPEQQLRLVLRNAPIATADRGEKNTAKTGERSDVTLHAAEKLCSWHLEDPDVFLDVKKKQRAGKKLGAPGNGWLKKRSKGRTCTMSLAGAMVRQMIFDRAQQFCVKVEESQIPGLVRGLCELLQSSAVVLAAADDEQLRAAEEGSARRLTFVTEIDDPDYDPSQVPTVEEPPRTEPPRREQRRGRPVEEEKPDIIPATVDIPAEAKGSKLLFVLGGDMLRETSSVTKVIWALKDEEPVIVFHLATSTRHRLHLPSLGLVVRIKDRFGCRIPELPVELLEQILAVRAGQQGP